MYIYSNIISDLISNLPYARTLRSRQQHYDRCGCLIQYYCERSNKLLGVVLGDRSTQKKNESDPIDS